MVLTLEEKRRKVFNFFDNFIENFIVKDLEILGFIKPDKTTGFGGCTIPTAMVIISSMELLGFLLNKSGKTGESGKNISFFINYENLFPTYYNADATDKICNYRQGMMHHFFPKFKGNFSGICKDSSNTNLFIPHLISGQSEDSLNVDVLHKDFIIAKNRLRVLLEKTDDENVFDDFLRGLKNLDYSLAIYPATTLCTTINPGTPKSK